MRCALRALPCAHAVLCTALYAALTILAILTMCGCGVLCLVMNQSLAFCHAAWLQVGKPLFPGNTESDLLDKICQIMGTPTAEQWPDAPSLPQWVYGLHRAHGFCRSHGHMEGVLALLQAYVGS